MESVWMLETKPLPLGHIRLKAIAVIDERLDLVLLSRKLAATAVFKASFDHEARIHLLVMPTLGDVGYFTSGTGSLSINFCDGYFTAKA